MESLQGSFRPLSVTPSSISQRPTDPLPPPARSLFAKSSRRPLNHWLPRPRRFFLRKSGARGANGSQEHRFLLQGPSAGLAGQEGLLTGQAGAPAAQPSPPLLLPESGEGGLALAQSRGGHTETAWSPSGNRSYCGRLFRALPKPDECSPRPGPTFKTVRRPRLLLHAKTAAPFRFSSIGLAQGVSLAFLPGEKR